MTESPTSVAEARKAAVAYLRALIPNDLRVHDGPPPGAHPYLPEPPENYWFVAAPSERMSFGASNYVIVSKRTGMVVDVQRLGE